MMDDNRKLIMIVDDMEGILSVLKDYLHEFGHLVIDAKNVKAAKEILESRHIDLIITDISMPEESGIALMKWAHETHPQVPVILMTGFEDLLHSMEKMAHNKVHVLSKPFNKEDLQEQIKRAIENAERNSGYTVDDEFTTIATSEFVSGESINYPIYVRLSKSKYVKVASSGESIDRERVKQFEERGITNLYLTNNDFRKYVENAVRTANRLLESDKASPELKRNFMLRTGQIVIEKIYNQEVCEESFVDAKRFVEMSLDIVTDSKDVLDILDFINSTNEPLYAHQLAVSIYSVMLAKEMEWESPKTLQTLSIAGLFHDIGKKNIKLEVLNKHESELTPEEEHLIKAHPLKGAEIVDDLKQFEPTVVQVILQHHENCIGTGHPFKLKRSHITPCARIISLVDIFCHYILKTKFVEPIPPSEAILQIDRFHSSEVDREMFDALKRMIKN